jgi:hypothetical protein
MGKSPPLNWLVRRLRGQITEREIMLEIDCESEGFPNGGPLPNGSDVLSVSWDDLLWAAVTVGRPNRSYVFRNGNSSLYEALFRISAVRMSLEQIGPSARRLRRIAAAKSLDPSEKGAVNYFLGLTLCKLFAAKKLNAPWLLHLDVFRPQLNPTLLSGRSRPDLVGQTNSGDWVALESKGRASPPVEDAKAKAKLQAERLIAINGTLVQFRIGAFAYFKNDTLKFFWRDPQPDGVEPRNPIRLKLTEDEFWRRYYQPILGLVGPDHAATIERENIPLPIKEADLKIKVLPEVMRLLRLEKWKDVGHWCMENQKQLAKSEVHGDGLQIIAGESWSKPFEEKLR